MGYEDDMTDYLYEKDPAYAGRQENALARQRAARKNPFPPEPLTEGRKGVIITGGYSGLTMPESSGWTVIGGWQDK